MENTMALPKWTDERTSNLVSFVGDESPISQATVASAADELETSIKLIIKTKCPTKWIIEDLETGQKYRANGKTEIGKMFTLIS